MYSRYRIYHLVPKLSYLCACVLLFNLFSCLIIDKKYFRITVGWAIFRFFLSRFSKFNMWSWTLLAPVLRIRIRRIRIISLDLDQKLGWIRKPESVSNYADTNPKKTMDNKTQNTGKSQLRREIVGALDFKKPTYVQNDLTL